MQSGAITGKAATNLTGVDDCVPTQDKRAKVKKWVKPVPGEVRHRPAVQRRRDVHAVQMFNAAVKKAGSTYPAAVVEALRSQEYDGICTTYKSDDTNVLNHAADLIKFDANGKKKIVRHFTFGELAAPAATTTAPASSDALSDMTAEPAVDRLRT